MDTLQLVSSIILSGYLGLVLFVGVWVARGGTTSSDWQFSPEGLGILGIASVLVGTQLGAASTVGVAEDVFNIGVATYAFIVSGALGFVLAGLTTGRFFYRTKMMTLVAFNVHRFSRRFAFLGVGLGLIIGMIVNGVQLLGVALIIQSLTGLSLVWGVVIGSFLGWIYLMLGGLSATSATNIIHLGVCLGGLILGAVVLVDHTPLSEALAGLPDGHLDPTGNPMYIIHWLIVGVASHFVSNVYYSPLASADTEREAVASCLWSGLIYLLFGLLTMTVGIYAVGVFAPLYEQATGGALTGELAFGTVAHLIGDPQFGGGPVGLVVGTIMMAGVIGAIISTMAPLVWNIATILSQDLYREYLYPDASDREELLAARVFTTLYWVIPAVVALIIGEGLLSTLLFLLELPTGAMLPIILCFFWERVNEPSAFYTLVASVGTGLIYRPIAAWYPDLMEGLGPWFGSSVGWITTVSLLVFAGALLFGDRPEEEKLEVVRRARAEEPPLPSAPGSEVPAGGS